MENEEHISSEIDNRSEHISSETTKEIDETSEKENLKKIEAALFLSARFLSLNDLVMLTDINPLMVRELIEKLDEKYNLDERAIEIISKEDMWKMDVRQEYVSMINKLATGSAEFSKAEQETLAVIAYKQPVKQSIIINIRGNKAYEHVKHFIEIGLVKAKRLGHTKELGLSDEFFEYFHLQKKGDGTTELVVEGTDEVVVDDVEDVGEMEEEKTDESTDISNTSDITNNPNASDNNDESKIEDTNNEDNKGEDIDNDIEEKEEEKEEVIEGG
tara:strand:- start:755 stop:1573 length:819 start_codon:yes stop_codon:yes gene_type:complete